MENCHHDHIQFNLRRNGESTSLKECVNRIGLQVHTYSWADRRLNFDHLLAERLPSLGIMGGISNAPPSTSLYSKLKFYIKLTCIQIKKQITLWKITKLWSARHWLGLITACIYIYLHAPHNLEHLEKFRLVQKQMEKLLLRAKSFHFERNFRKLTS